MWEVLWDTVLDILKLLPLLYLAYLLMEFLENKLEGHSEGLIKKAGRFGPAVGGLLGVIPQCGFSAAASGLYSGGVITIGTLFAIYLSTSDEMLPIMLSSKAPAATILLILAIKLAIGMAMGFLIDLIFHSKRRGTISEMCEREKCDCDKNGIFLSALKHTLSVTLFIFLITLALNTAVHFIGEKTLSGLIIARPVVGSLITAAVGLIPNCAASVVLTELYLEKLISSGALIAGLLSGSGIGLLVLFRTNRNPRENLLIVAGLYAIGAAFGVIFDLLGVVL